MKLNKNRIYLLIAFLSIISSSFAYNQGLFDKGKIAFKNKDYKTAINNFSKSLNHSKADKSEKLIYYYRAMSYLYLQKVEKAIVDFNTIIKLDASFPDAYNSRGLCYGYLGKIDKAVADFNKSIKLDSNFAQAYINLGSAYMAQNKYNLAEKMFDNVIKIDPSNPANYYLRASLHYMSGNYKQAIKDYTKSINNGLKDTRNYYERANSYYKLKKYLKAIADYTTVIKLDKDNIDALNNRAASYMTLGLEKKANKDRLRIAILSAGIKNTPPIKSIKFKKYKFLNGKILIELPSSWFSATESTKFGKIKVIAKDTIKKTSDSYLIGVRFSLDSNMAKQFKVNTKKEILNFWEKSTKMNTKSYVDYTKIHQENYKINDYSGYLKTVRIIISKDAYPIRYYELVLAKENVLFYIFMQSPEIQFAYYKQIFDKAIKSIKINY